MVIFITISLILSNTLTPSPRLAGPFRSPPPSAGRSLPHGPCFQHLILLGWRKAISRQRRTRRQVGSRRSGEQSGVALGFKSPRVLHRVACLGQKTDGGFHGVWGRGAPPAQHDIARQGQGRASRVPAPALQTADGCILRHDASHPEQAGMCVPFGGDDRNGEK